MGPGNVARVRAAILPGADRGLKRSNPGITAPWARDAMGHALRRPHTPISGAPIDRDATHALRSRDRPKRSATLRAEAMQGRKPQATHHSLDGGVVGPRWDGAVPPSPKHPTQAAVAGPVCDAAANDLLTGGFLGPHHRRAETGPWRHAAQRDGPSATCRSLRCVNSGMLPREGNRMIHIEHLPLWTCDLERLAAFLRGGRGRTHHLDARPWVRGGGRPPLDRRRLLREHRA